MGQMTWYYAENNAQQGPVSDDQMRALAASGRVSGQTLVWKDGMANWLALEQAAPHLVATPAAMAAQANAPVPDQAFPALGPETALCSTCNKFKPLDQIVMIAGQRVCASCKPASLQRIRQGETPGPQFRYAGFWIRFVAYVLDVIILLPISVGVTIFLLPTLLNPENVAANLLANLGLTLVQFAYKVFFNGKYGATPGKLVVGLKIVRTDGSGLGYGLATGRLFAEFISAIIFGIGYIIAAFDPEKRSLHDRICNTRVIYK